MVDFQRSGLSLFPLGQASPAFLVDPELWLVAGAEAGVVATAAAAVVVATAAAAVVVVLKKEGKKGRERERGGLFFLSVEFSIAQSSKTQCRR